MMGQPTARTMKNRHVLNGVSMPVFESAVGNPVLIQAPAPPDCLNRVGSSPATLFQAVEQREEFQVQNVFDVFGL